MCLNSFFKILKKKLFLTTKQLLVMKMIAFLMLVALLQVSAKNNAQVVTIEGKNLSMETVFQKIHDQTGFNFLYKNEWLRQMKKVTIHAVNAPVKDLLEQCFKQQPFTYKMMDISIVISPLPQVEIDTELENNYVETPPQDTISGRVLNESGKPIAGATVTIKGTKYSVATNSQGYYSIIINPNAKTIVFSHIGFRHTEIAIKGRREINITMELASTKLDEVVVQTGMFKKSLETYTGAATTVTAKEMQEFSNRNMITALRNIDPSFNLVENNSIGSDPNKLPEIQIRGNSSLPNVTQLQDQTRVGLNTPLIVIDGFETSLQRLLDMNPNEVASITILKDASATAIYGSRAANGVVVITTLMPKSGKLRISYRGDFNAEIPDLTAYHVLDARQKLDLEKKVGLYTALTPEQQAPLTRYYNYLVNEISSGVNTYWLSQPLRAPIDQRHNLRMEGGEQAFKYSISGQFNDIEGVMKGSSRKIFNGTANLLYLYRNVKFSNNLMVGNTAVTNSQYGQFRDFVKMNPYWRIRDSMGGLINILGYPGNDDYKKRWIDLPDNPMFNASTNSFDKNSNLTLSNNTSIEWQINNDFILRTGFGVNYNMNESHVFRSADNTAFSNYPETDFYRKGDYSYTTGKSMTLTGMVNLSYRKQIRKVHNIFVGANYNILSNTSSSYSFRAEGFNNPSLTFLSSALQFALNTKPSGTESKSTAIGITGNLNYAYNNKYFMDFSLRMDGSSSFGANNRFAPFWSGGLGWNIEKEKFMKPVKFVNQLKLRGSLGITGSQNFAPYQALATYLYYTDLRYLNWIGSYLLALENPDLKWQQTMNYNMGLDAQFFNQFLGIKIDYYTRTTTNLISSMELAPSSGFKSYTANVGSIMNNGIEFKTTAYLFKNYHKKFTWSITAAAFKNSNKIIKTSQALKDAQKVLELTGGGNPTTLYREGYPIASLWVVPSMGIDPGTGKEVYRKKDGTPTYIWDVKDLSYMGCSDPKLTGSLSTMFRYKSLSANIVFGFRLGAQLYNSTLIEKVENGDYRYNVDSRVYTDRWQKPGDIAAFKGLMVTQGTQKTSRFIQQESTITCRNINLQYMVRSNYLANKLKYKSLNFSLSVADLFYISTVKMERGIVYPFSHQGSFSISLSY